MGWSGYVYSDPPSMTAMKYQRQPYSGAALKPGERFSVCREMENSVRLAMITVLQHSLHDTGTDVRFIHYYKTSSVKYYLQIS